MDAETSPRLNLPDFLKGKIKDPKVPEFLKGEEGKYRDLLRFRCEKNETASVANLFPWHARVAVQELFFHAVKLQLQAQSSPICARLLSGSANNFVYGDITLKVIQYFLSIGGSVFCLVTSPNFTTRNCELARCADEYEKFKIRRVKNAGPLLAIPHFLVVEKSAFRIEASTHPDNVSTDVDFDTISPETPATISFNNDSLGKQLVALFETIWDSPGMSMEIPASNKK